MADAILGSEGPRTFSLKQVLAIIAVLIPMSGGGGALTATARDQTQDDNIEVVKVRLSAVEGELKALSQKQDLVNDAAEKRVTEFKDDVKSDIKELRGLVIRSLRRNE